MKVSPNITNVHVENLHFIPELTNVTTTLLCFFLLADQRFLCSFLHFRKFSDSPIYRYRSFSDSRVLQSLPAESRTHLHHDRHILEHGYVHGLPACDRPPLRVFVLAEHMALLSKMGLQSLPECVCNLHIWCGDSHGRCLLRGDCVLHLDKAEATAVVQQEGILCVQESQKALQS